MHAPAQPPFQQPEHMVPPWQTGQRWTLPHPELLYSDHMATAKGHACFASGNCSTICARAGCRSRKRRARACTDMNLVATGINAAWMDKRNALATALHSAAGHHQLLTGKQVTKAMGMSFHTATCEYLQRDPQNQSKVKEQLGSTTAAAYLT